MRLGQFLALILVASLSSVASAESLKVGEQAPTFSLQGSDGKTFRLAESLEIDFPLLGDASIETAEDMAATLADGVYPSADCYAVVEAHGLKVIRCDTNLVRSKSSGI
jgi:hypothetical protein